MRIQVTEDLQSQIPAHEQFRIDNVRNTEALPEEPINDIESLRFVVKQEILGAVTGLFEELGQSAERAEFKAIIDLLSKNIEVGTRFEEGKLKVDVNLTDIFRASPRAFEKARLVQMLLKVESILCSLEIDASGVVNYSNNQIELSEARIQKLTDDYLALEPLHRDSKEHDRNLGIEESTINKHKEKRTKAEKKLRKLKERITKLQSLLENAFNISEEEVDSLIRDLRKDGLITRPEESDIRIAKDYERSLSFEIDVDTFLEPQEEAVIESDITETTSKPASPRRSNKGKILGLVAIGAIVTGALATRNPKADDIDLSTVLASTSAPAPANTRVYPQSPRPFAAQELPGNYEELELQAHMNHPVIRSLIDRYERGNRYQFVAELRIFEMSRFENRLREFAAHQPIDEFFIEGRAFTDIARPHPEQDLSFTEPDYYVVSHDRQENPNGEAVTSILFEVQYKEHEDWTTLIQMHYNHATGELDAHMVIPDREESMQALMERDGVTTEEELERRLHNSDKNSAMQSLVRIDQGLGSPAWVRVAAHTGERDPITFAPDIYLTALITFQEVEVLGPVRIYRFTSEYPYLPEWNHEFTITMPVN